VSVSIIAGVVKNKHGSELAYDVFIADIIIGVTSLAILIGCAVSLESAKIRAKVLNREFGTEYTQEDIFWAGNLINQIIYDKKKRIEGDLNVTVNEKLE
jgi:hypothetical protein